MTPFQYIERPAVFSAKGAATKPVYAVTPAELDEGRIKSFPFTLEEGAPKFIPKAGILDSKALAWAKASGFKAEAGAFLLVPDENGDVGSAIFGLGSDPLEAPFIGGKLSKLLPSGDWRIEAASVAPKQFALGYGLGSYSFTRYKSEGSKDVRLSVDDAADIERQLAAVFLARDLVNTPTNEMGPIELETAFRALGDYYGATVTSIVGEDLLEENFPLIHTVGRASVSPPRLLELRWGEQGHPRVTLVGKGVCFDTGGLDIKGAANMALMKKDMGGAANVMGLALMVMDAGLKVDLQVLVPAVENSISGNAFRPGDIYRSRKGITVQIDNTDAEGRLVLADALAYADENPPDLMIDMSTLTGAARVALGTELAPYFTDDEALSAKLAEAAKTEADPMWRLPLWMGYDKDIRARAADITNSPSGGMAGAITAALFLKRFVTATKSWAHFDIYAWVLADKPHAPVGGEAFAIRALYRVVRDVAAK
ncbi:leucyl aminopeptidase family protein [Neorhizobium alkalisoli]|uniref:leucyl aminopeptidase family protein n=1 Tax=Neorhizobium alkalisoli TaxID=528178 RepID=UPI000CF8ED6F|nr:leucyl aminopeptidase family protein [Neorhizobium alkalisoli]